MGTWEERRWDERVDGNRQGWCEKARGMSPWRARSEPPRPPQVWCTDPQGPRPGKQKGGRVHGSNMHTSLTSKALNPLCSSHFQMRRLPFLSSQQKNQQKSLAPLKPTSLFTPSSSPPVIPSSISRSISSLDMRSRYLWRGREWRRAKGRREKARRGERRQEEETPPLRGTRGEGRIEEKKGEAEKARPRGEEKSGGGEWRKEEERVQRQVELTPDPRAPIPSIMVERRGVRMWMPGTCGCPVHVDGCSVHVDARIWLPAFGCPHVMCVGVKVMQWS